MRRTQLGRTGLSISPLVFGANVFGWTVNEADSFSLLDALFERGINILDTADVYSAWAPGNQGGESETIIGKWLRQSGKRDQVLIATKVGLWSQRPGLGAANIRAALEDSLRRLQTDRIDIYYSHLDDEKTPLAETLGAHAQLVAEGKVRVLGASNYSAARLREAMRLSSVEGVPGYQVLQPHYNLVERAVYEQELEPLAQEKGLGVMCYYALASGFLSGKYRRLEDLAGRARGQKIEAYMNPRGLGVLAALDAVAEAHGSTPATVALAWLMARPSISAPIASATSVAQIDALADAASLTLTPAQIAQLDTASAWR